jgi:hypothetical protein
MNKFVFVIILCYCGSVLSLNKQSSFTYEVKNSSTPSVFRDASEEDCCLNEASCCPVGYYCCPGSTYCCASGKDDCCNIGTGWNDCGSGKNSDCCYGWSCSAGCVCIGFGNNGQCSQTSHNQVDDSAKSSYSLSDSELTVVVVVVVLVSLFGCCFCCYLFVCQSGSTKNRIYAVEDK